MKFCYNNNNLARQVPRNDRLWWFIAVIMTVFLLFKKENKMATNYAIGPVPTPYPPSGKTYTPQLSGGQVYDDNTNVITNPNSQYALPGGAPEPTYTSSNTYVVPKTTVNPTTTTPTPTPTPQPQNPVNDFDTIYNAMYPGWDRNAAEQDWIAKGRPSGGGSGGGGVDLNAQLRSLIESGYDSYINDLNNLYGGLTTQAGAQENIAQNSYEQSINDLLANQQSSLGDLGLTEQKLQANQVKNLRDIASNIQNQYMAGNVMLGARGAGDSSAANQYSYALNRVGSKARGDVMNQTAASQAELDNQKAKLNNIVTQETSKFDTELANAKQGISSWLAEQQNNIGLMISQGKLQKSNVIADLTQNLLNQAISAYNTKVQEISNKKTALESWALSKATSIKDAISKMNEAAAWNPTMPTAGTINGGVTTDAQGNMRGLFGYGTSNSEDSLKKLLGY